jgi:uncharacterized protein (TIGR02246 family)
MFEYETRATALHKTRFSRRGHVRRAGMGLLACVLVAGSSGPVSAANARDEGAVRALAEGFAKGFLQKNATARASLFVQDGTIVLPPGTFLRGRVAMIKDFGPESQQLVNPATRVTFSNYRFRFVKPDVAVVDTLLAARNLNGGNGKIIPQTLIDFSYVAVRQGNRWLIEDARLHFAPAQAKGMTKSAQTSNM